MAPPPRLTHFLCIPLVTPTSRAQLQANLMTFRTEVSQATAQNPRGIPEQAIRPVGTLHLTLGVMSLLTPAHVEAALGVLRSLDLRGQMAPREVGGAAGGASSSSRPAPLTATLRGLESMHDPARTSVLYAPPVDEDRSLYEFCLKLREAFQAAGLLIPDTRPLLLHATVLNTVYVPHGPRKGAKRAPRLTIDARDLLQRYESLEWMNNIRVEKVAICRMGARTLAGGDEEYVVEGEVAIP